MLSSGNEARIGGSLSYVNNKLYAYGGQTEINPCEDLNCRVAVNTLEVYNLTNNAWSNLTSAGEVRSDHSAVVYGDKIYFFGGQGNTGILNSLQFYDTQSQSWTNLSSCPQARYGHTAFEYNDEMFIWGGVLNTEDGDLFSLNSMWVYDFAKDEWRSETPGGEPRAFHSVSLRR